MTPNLRSIPRVLFRGREARERRAAPSSLSDAAMAPATTRGGATRILLIALGIPVVAAVGAFGYQFVAGIGVSGLNDQVFWGLYTVDLVTFIGFSYGGALVSAILRLTGAAWRGPIVRIAEGTALVTLLIGAAFPIIHLGHPERAWEMITRPQLNSPIVWDMVAILTYLLVTVMLFVFPLIPDLAEVKDRDDLGRFRVWFYEKLSMGWRGTRLQREKLERILSVLAIAVIPIAIMVHTVLSYAFSLTSRPGWHSTIFGPYFVLGAIYSGVAIVVIASVAYRKAFDLGRWITERSIRFLSYLMVALGVLYAYFFFSEVTTDGYVGEAASQVLLRDLLMGRFAPLLWTFVAVGLVLPTLIVAIPRTRTVGGLAAAAVMVAVGMWLKRFLIVVPPLVRPLVGGEAGSYSPSAVEWIITAGALAAVPFLLVLLFRFVPVLAIHEIRELESEPQRDISREPRPTGVAREATT